MYAIRSYYVLVLAFWSVRSVTCPVVSSDAPIRCNIPGKEAVRPAGHANELERWLAQDARFAKPQKRAV